MQGQPHSSTHPSLVPRAALASASASHCWLLQLVVSNTCSSAFCWAVLFQGEPKPFCLPHSWPWGESLEGLFHCLSPRKSSFTYCFDSQSQIKHSGLFAGHSRQCLNLYCVLSKKKGLSVLLKFWHKAARRSIESTVPSNTSLTCTRHSTSLQDTQKLQKAHSLGLWYKLNHGTKTKCLK